ncbi:hypothetical protein AgCh_010477 [Apium graveolens]
MESSRGREGEFGLSYPILVKSNYTVWATKMKVFMRAHGVWEAIEPKNPKAALEDKAYKRFLYETHWFGYKDQISRRSDWRRICSEEVAKSLTNQGQEERIQGQQQLLLTEEEWLKKEKQVSKLLLTREEWLKRSGKNNAVGGSDYRVRDNRLVRDRCTVKYFNCGSYRHFVIECRISRKVRQPKEEVNLTQLNDDEPALLMVMCERGAEDIIMLTKDKKPTNKKEMEENTWYLDNGASNHMTGHREKFEKLYSIEKGEVRLGDGSLVKIEGKGTI